MVLEVKNLLANAGYWRDAGSIPRWGRSPGDWSINPQPTPVFLPGESHGQEPGRLQSIRSQSRPGLKQLNTHAHYVVVMATAKFGYKNWCWLHDTEFVARKGDCATCLFHLLFYLLQSTSPLLMQEIEGRGRVLRQASTGSDSSRLLYHALLSSEAPDEMVATGNGVCLFHRLVPEAGGTKRTSVIPGRRTTSILSTVPPCLTTLLGNRVTYTQVSIGNWVNWCLKFWHLIFSVAINSFTAYLSIYEGTSLHLPGHSLKLTLFF